MSDGARKTSPKSTFHFLAGLSSGITSAVLLQPIDLLKTRVQQRTSHSTPHHPHGASALRLALAEIRSAPHLLPALWRGAVPSALRTGFGSAIYFTSLNSIRHRLSSPALANASNHSSTLPKLSHIANLTSGAVARSFAGFILMPLTVLKVRYESTLYNYNSLPRAALDIYRHEGIRGFFSGFGATAIRDAPYAGLYILFYEQSKKHLSNLYMDKSGNGGAATINFASAIFSGAVCSAISNPFDAVKTRIQLQPDGYRNMVHAAKRMVSEEGLRSLMDGLGLRMGRKAASSALAWTVYEELIRRAEGSWTKKDGVRGGEKEAGKL
ncbi:MICOS complex subunit mic13 [Podospora pseudopauciseta]|uniref:Mitochondrial glycine transporter n=2 Tax=Podospora TaxID=5144 RepID=A0ABR0I294_9PEZI|nr:MICOS complex subunit mic13 [Podospora pseudopauciseta]KAK4682721.1 MICOS complex subunit mic13 [Podospora pseudoanserina]